LGGIWGKIELGVTFTAGQIITMKQTTFADRTMKKTESAYYNTFGRNIRRWFRPVQDIADRIRGVRAYVLDLVRQTSTTLTRRGRLYQENCYNPIA
jgi:hypothetical protein